MKTITLTTPPDTTEDQAAEICKQLHGWTPDAVRKVESGQDGFTAYRCFESAADARIWDAQK